MVFPFFDRIYRICRIFLPFLKKGKKCQPSSRELIELKAAKV